MQPEEIKQPHIHTIIAGAGISGIRAALDLADMGHPVLLIDKAGSSGGILSQLDRQFPDNHCGMCTMLPMIDRDKGSQFCLRKGLFHENVTFLPSTEIISVQGPEKNLTVILEKQHTGIDPDLCIGCGQCSSVCPVSVPDEFNAGLSQRKAAFLPVPHQIPNRRIIDFDACTQCGECVKGCPTDAISLEGEATRQELKNISAVILATGSGRYNPANSDLYGFGTLPNVVTADGFERIMNSKGPSEGKLIRPSDGKEVKKAAWLQCVGSRNIMENADHCSSACCMFALKEAVLASEKAGESFNATFFYMDFRTHGRDFQRVLDDARKKHHLDFIRCRIHSIEPCGSQDDLRLSYLTPKGEIASVIVDLVVLSTGKDPSLKLPEYARNPGVFAVSDTLEFKDVAESVIGAHNAAQKAMALTGLPITTPKEPLDISVGFTAPHLLVAWCSCGRKNDIVSTAEKIREQLNAMPDKIDFFELENACTDQGLEQLRDTILRKKANRIVLAACHPFLFIHKIKEMARAVKLPVNFFKTVAVHSDPGTPFQANAVQKIFSQIQGAIAQLRRTNLNFETGRPVTPSALVVGAGPAGLSAALSIADAGIHVDMIEASAAVGGNSHRFSDGPEKKNAQALISAALEHPGIDIHLDARITLHQGIAGAFTTEITTQKNPRLRLQHGAAIIATGGQAVQTDAYSLSKHPEIISLFDFEAAMQTRKKDLSGLSHMVFIQCAGTREEPRNYCSRVCCAKALQLAENLRKTYPEMKITVFYRDIMTYGQSEKLYTQARKSGVLFVPYDPREKPQLEIKDNQIRINAWNPVTQEDMAVSPGLVVLSTGVVPSESSDIAELFRLPLTRDGFFKEVNSKWRPTDSGREGIFVCGLGRAPLRAIEAMDEGTAAAMRALRILGRSELPVSIVTAKVRHSLCSRCLACIPECPYNARYINTEDGRVMVDASACQGCGACAAVCPNSTNIMGQFEETGIMDTIEHFLNEELSI